jgi:hypothetical protein
MRDKEQIDQPGNAEQFVNGEGLFEDIYDKQVEKFSKPIECGSSQNIMAPQLLWVLPPNKHG